MRDRALYLKKKIIPMENDVAWLDKAELEQLAKLKAEYEEILPSLSEVDLEWMDEKMSIWFSQYHHQETVGYMKPI